MLSRPVRHRRSDDAHHCNLATGSHRRCRRRHCCAAAAAAAAAAARRLAELMLVVLWEWVARCRSCARVAAPEFGCLLELLSACSNQGSTGDAGATDRGAQGLWASLTLWLDTSAATQAAQPIICWCLLSCIPSLSSLCGAAPRRTGALGTTSREAGCSWGSLSPSLASQRHVNSYTRL